MFLVLGSGVGLGFGFWVLVFRKGFGFWCQTLCSVGEAWVEQDYANLSDTERGGWVSRIERICVIPSGEFRWARLSGSV